HTQSHTARTIAELINRDFISSEPPGYRGCSQFPVGTEAGRNHQSELMQTAGHHLPESSVVSVPVFAQRRLPFASIPKPPHKPGPPGSPASAELRLDRMRSQRTKQNLPHRPVPRLF